MNESIPTQKPSENDIAQLLEPIEVAIALGAEIPAPVGTSVVLAYICARPKNLNLVRDWNETRILGFYETLEAAEASVRDWVLSQWSYYNLDERPPWETNLGYGLPHIEELKLKSHFLVDSTDKEIIEAYFNQKHRTEYDYSYHIVEQIVKPFIPRLENR